MSGLRVDHPDVRATGSYYDTFADIAEQRYASNHVLVRIREAFRRAVERYPASSMLDLGCGPGTDLAWFMGRYPARRFFGIDVSPRMVELARQKFPGGAAQIARGCAEDLPSVFSGERFDLVYSFFGPLNTEPSLEHAVRALTSVLTPNGVLVLTFVSRIYLLDSAIHALRGRARRAIARLTDRWRGYNELAPLDATLYFPRQIARQFASAFTIERSEGFSILYPAWYRAGHFREGGATIRTLWLADRLLNRTPLRFVGEHMLYALRRHP